MKKLVSAGSVVYRTQNNAIEYLLIQHASDGEHWDFPKGKLEEGEDFLQAALRELKEETGLETIVHDGFDHTIVYTFADRDGEEVEKIVHFFVGLVQSSSVKLSPEHKDFVWLVYDAARKKLTYDSAKNILDKVHEFVGGI